MPTILHILLDKLFEISLLDEHKITTEEHGAVQESFGNKIIEHSYKKHSERDEDEYLGEAADIDTKSKNLPTNVIGLSLEDVKALQTKKSADDDVSDAESELSSLPSLVSDPDTCPKYLVRSFT